jgi:hypothetical protein
MCLNMSADDGHVLAALQADQLQTGGHVFDSSY